MTANEIDNFNDLLSDAENGAKTEWEMEFISGIQVKYAQWGDRMFVSDKQLAILERMAEDV